MWPPSFNGSMMSGVSVQGGSRHGSLGTSTWQMWRERHTDSDGAPLLNSHHCTRLRCRPPPSWRIASN
jgi:hypothetical protein